MALSKADMLAIAQMVQAAPAATPAPVEPSVLAGPAHRAAVTQQAVPSASGLAVTIAGQTFYTGPHRSFKSGRSGFNLTGKAVIDGKRYQVSGNLIELDPKGD